MTVREFEEAGAVDFSGLLLALWWDVKGDWARVHAYLHRKEGDTWNAGYWYRRAGRPEAKGSLRDEWEEIVAEFLSRA